ncbi:MAG: hypothetical protein NTZ69_17830 [Bacteroidia bacterium]|nr:hypothetical protein [Bacteroidia bacterium]
MSCTKQPYYEIPKDASGKAIITQVSTTSTTGVTALDDKFTVNSTLPNAKSGDVMTAELLKMQIPSWGGTATQNLPLANTKKQVTVGADLKTSVTYTRAEAQMTKIGDFVTFTLAGATESGYISTITVTNAMTVGAPMSGATVVSVIRTPEVAYMQVKVVPKVAAYSGVVTASRKNGVNGSWVPVGTGTYSAPPFMIPVSGSDFAAGKDTMYYKFSAAVGTYTEDATTTVLVSDPFFFLKKSATSTLGGSSAGRNILTNTAVSATDANAIIAVDGGSLVIHGGSAWAVGAKSIGFVKTTKVVFDANNAATAMAAFDAGTSAATADPSNAYYIFKIVNGTNASDIYYGVMQITGMVPGVSVSYDYRIGNLYAHWAVIK